METVYAAQELTGDLLYELTIVQKMDYQPACDVRPNQDLPTTSE